LATGGLDGFLSAERIDHRVPAIALEPTGGTFEQGRHLAQLCTGCHQPNLAGGRMSHGGPAAPLASNLTPSNQRFAAWSREDFLRAMRTGKRPDGTAINGRYMPWRAIGQSSDEELSALWIYLQSLPTGAGSDEP
jgi:cytochrome c553